MVSEGGSPVEMKGGADDSKGSVKNNSTSHQPKGSVNENQANQPSSPIKSDTFDTDDKNTVDNNGINREKPMIPNDTFDTVNDTVKGINSINSINSISVSLGWNQNLSSLFSSNIDKILYYLLLTTTPSRLNELDEKLGLPEGTAKLVVHRHSEKFIAAGKDGRATLYTLSERGKTYIESLLENLERKQQPSYSETHKKEFNDLMIEVRNFIANQREAIPLVPECVVSMPNLYPIDFLALRESNPSLAMRLEDDPDTVLEAFTSYLQESLQEPYTAILVNVPRGNDVSLGSIRARHQKRLISFEGVVVVKSKTEPRTINARFECPNCGNLIQVPQPETKFKEPSRCSCGWKSSFKLIDKEIVDEQKLQLEEPQDLVERDPETINVVIQGPLADPLFDTHKTIGQRVRIIGIVDAEAKYLKSGGVSTAQEKYVRILSIEQTQTNFSDLKITDEDIQQIREYAQSGNVALRIGRMAFPNIVDHEEIKQALVLQLAGGMKKDLPDLTTRGDIHILLIGDPGVAKSVLLKGVEKIAPKARYISGAGTSKVGLIGTVRKNEFLGTWVAEGGALARANGGIVLADELDKMSEDDQGGLHVAMEQQRVPLDKGNVHTTLKTETALLGAANPRGSQWDMNKSLWEQFNLPQTLQGRFDLIFPLKDIVDFEKDKNLAYRILMPVKEGVDFAFIRKYLVYARSITPRIPPEMAQLISELYANMRMLSKEKRGLINARDVRSIERLSEAAARIRLSKVVEECDVKLAVSLHRYCLEQLNIYIVDMESEHFSGDANPGQSPNARSLEARR